MENTRLYGCYCFIMMMRQPVISGALPFFFLFMILEKCSNRNSLDSSSVMSDGGGRGFESCKLRLQRGRADQLEDPRLPVDLKWIGIRLGDSATD
jgi:hypothetical protein